MTLFPLILGGIFVSAARSAHTRDAAQKVASQRLILVYDEERCGVRSSEKSLSNYDDAADAATHKRELVLRELGRRIREFKANRPGSPLVISESNLRGGYKDFLGGDEDEDKPESLYLQGVDMEIAHLPQGMDLEEFHNLSLDLPCVKYVEKDTVVRATDPYPPIEVPVPSNNDNQKFLTAFSSSNNFSVIQQGAAPSDVLYEKQWPIKAKSSSLYGINAEEVWRRYNEYAQLGGGQGHTPVVALVDSGCAMKHPDLVNQYWRNPNEICGNGIDDDGNGFIDDCHGWDFVEEDNDPSAEKTSHGSAAAGIIAAEGNNSQGVAGVCWNCKIMCLRFISDTEGTVTNEVRAIDYALRMGAKISNNSYGGYARGGTKAEKEAIERAYRRGHLFISSAGNGNAPTDDDRFFHTPSGYSIPNILSVGASTETGRKSSYSNFGPNSVHMFAPGHNVISTGLQGYILNQGTSFAAPHVAGIAGLIQGAFPNLSAAQMRRALLSSCSPSPFITAGMAKCGGVVDALRAMENAKNEFLTGSNNPAAAAALMLPQNTTPQGVNFNVKKSPLPPSGLPAPIPSSIFDGFLNSLLNPSGGRMRGGGGGIPTPANVAPYSFTNPFANLIGMLPLSPFA